MYFYVSEELRAAMQGDMENGRASSIMRELAEARWLAPGARKELDSEIAQVEAEIKQLQARREGLEARAASHSVALAAAQERAQAESDLRAAIIKRRESPYPTNWNAWLNPKRKDVRILGMDKARKILWEMVKVDDRIRV